MKRRIGPLGSSLIRLKYLKKLSLYAFIALGLFVTAVEAVAQHAVNISILTCEGDSTLLQANTSDQFKGWENQIGGVNGISNPDSVITWVNTKSVSKLTATSFYKGNNLIENGNFEAGNAGFTSEYGNVLGTNTFNQFAVGKDPIYYSPFFYVSRTDHTSSKGNMFIADGGMDTNKIVYTTPVSVASGKEYVFSIFLANVLREFSKPKIDTTYYATANFQFYIDSISIGSFKVPLDTSWHNYVVKFKSTKTGTGNLVIKSKVSNTNGNDFVMDDISLIPLESTKSPLLAVYPCNNLPVFSPDGDGQFDAYFIEKTGVAKIFDLGGNMINQINVPGNWDGSKSGGAMADNGYYAIVIDGHISHVSLVR